MLELQHLHDKFDIDGAANPCVSGCGASRIAPCASASAESHRPVLVAMGGRQLLPEPTATPARARCCGSAVNRPRLAEGLPLPELPRPFGEILGELVERNRERSATTRRCRQSYIHVIELAEGAELTGDFDDPLGELTEEMLIGRRSIPATTLTMPRLTIRLIQKDQIDVAVIVRLPCLPIFPSVSISNLQYT